MTVTHPQIERYFMTIPEAARLAGFVPAKDIKIEYVGLRPGEMMYEELAMNSEDVLPTAKPKIMKVKDNGISEAELVRRLKILEDALIAGDNYVGALQTVVQTFTPENRGRKRRVFEAQGLASGGLETGSFLHQTVRMLRRTLQVRMQRSTRL